MIKITIDILGKKWRGEAATMEGALKKIKLSWETIKGKGVMYITSGNKSLEILMPRHRLCRIFANKIMLAHWAKNLTTLLKEGKKLPKVQSTNKLKKQYGKENTRRRKDS